MDTEDDAAQQRIERWNEEQRRKKQAELLERYLARIKVYDDAWEANQWPIDFARVPA